MAFGPPIRDLGLAKGGIVRDGFNQAGNYSGINALEIGSQWGTAVSAQNDVWGGHHSSIVPEDGCLIIGTTGMAPWNLVGQATPIAFSCPSIEAPVFENFILSMEWTKTNEPGWNSSTSRAEMVVAMVDAGWRFQRPNGAAPVTTRLSLAYDFSNPLCFDGLSSGRVVTDLSGQGRDGTIQGVDNLYYWPSGGGRVGLDFSSGNTMINIDSQLTTATRNRLTYSVLGKRGASGGAQYLWDARNCGGTWMLTNYSGYDFNNGNSLRYNTSPPDGYGVNFHYCQAQGDGSQMYYNQSGNAVSEEGNVPGGPNGTDFRIGTRYTDSSRWNGYLAGFWIYDGQLNGDDIKIVNACNAYFWR